jgi:hypothetical protein
VIIGVGQVTRRDDDAALHPVALMAAAVRAAQSEAGLDSLAALDSLQVVASQSWRYAPNAAHALASELGIRPPHLAESSVGGEQPVVLLDAMATRLAAGEISLGVVAGGEAAASLSSAKRAGVRLPWPDKPARTGGSRVEAIAHPEAWRHGLRVPIQLYPLFENAFRAYRGLEFDVAQRESGEIWAALSRVAATNPYAWNREPRTADDVRTPGSSNPWICYPYPRAMNAFPNVNQAAAAIMTTRHTALGLGIPESELVYPIAAAGARERTDPLSRPDFRQSLAMEATLDSALERADATASEVEAWELYSCFPCVPKMAAGHLGLPRSTELSVTGGLSFFGGPGSNYMLHAAAAMVERLRLRPTKHAVLYGQGEFVTKHHALVLGSEMPGDYHSGGSVLPIQATIDAAPAPSVDPEPDGAGTIETFTAMWDREGQPLHAIIVGRLDKTGDRFVAHTDPDDLATFDALVSGDSEPIGWRVRVRSGAAVNIASISDLDRGDCATRGLGPQT